MIVSANKIEKHFSDLLQETTTWINDGGDPYLVNMHYRTLCDMAGFYDKYWGLSLEWVYRDVIIAQTTLSEALIFTAFMLKYRNQPQAALQVARLALDSGGKEYIAAIVAEFTRENGDLAGTRELCKKLLEQQPEIKEIQTTMSLCDVQEQLGSGDDYYQFLNSAHKSLSPEVYIEIGVSNGKSLALAKETTRALGIDPATASLDLLCFISPENSPQLYKVPSDSFFDDYDVPAEMGKNTFDMAFIDGLHVFEQALKDFVNLERYAGKDSVIFIHDCLPVNPLVAERERQSMFWTGDVWKVIPCLKELRPDLDIVTFPALPSGFAMIRNLDPGSVTLSRHFDSIVGHFIDLPLPESKEERFRLLNVHEGATIDAFQQMLAR